MMPASPEEAGPGDELRPEYDFRTLRGVVRGNYATRYRERLRVVRLAPMWEVSMTQLHKLAVEHYRAERVPNPNPSGEVSWRLYQTVRNAVVKACRRHGPTGPLGEFPLHKDSRDIFADWERGDKNPVYYVNDDQYNDERYLYMEFVDPAGCTPEWLADVTATLHRFPGWGIGVNGLRDGYLLIFADRLLVTGPQFRGCRDAASVVESMRTQGR